MDRNILLKINSLLEMFPAVVILGARQCGKTTLAKNCRPDWLYIDLEKPSDFNRVTSDPEFFLQQNPKNIIIDEAQLCPILFEVLRGTIDEIRDLPGRFLITGSSSPELLKNISESLAGRVATVELGTLKTNEIFDKPMSSFYSIFQEKLSAERLKFLNPPLLTAKEVQYSWFKGGYPEPVLKKSNVFYLQWMENYENTYIYRDIARLYPRLNKVAYQRFLTMLCKLSGTILNKSEVARALEVSEGSVREFLMIAEGTFLWRQLPSFEKSQIKSIVKMPKGHIRDSGLLHSLLRIIDENDLYRDPIIGHSFESFVIEEIIKGLQATMLTHWTSYYYRTRSGVEIDLILEGPFGLLPIEIKYGTKVTTQQLRSLEEFVIAHQLPFGLVINQAKEAYWLNRHIFQLPASYL
jgi:predicted AAA+ superfamily ATPase